MQIRVRGIDADGEPQDMTVEDRDAASLGRYLAGTAGWKYARLDIGSERAGEVAFSLAERRRTWR
jgi:hypothetical protein